MALLISGESNNQRLACRLHVNDHEPGPCAITNGGIYGNVTSCYFLLFFPFGFGQQISRAVAILLALICTCKTDRRQGQVEDPNRHA